MRYLLCFASKEREIGVFYFVKFTQEKRDIIFHSDLFRSHGRIHNNSCICQRDCGTLVHQTCNRKQQRGNRCQIEFLMLLDKMFVRPNWWSCMPIPGVILSVPLPGTASPEDQLSGTVGCWLGERGTSSRGHSRTSLL